jgi:YidC/Oxa1 family membrane protein insertase
MADTKRADEMNDQKNMLLAIVLSAIVLIGWQIFFGLPGQQAQKQQPQQQQQTQTPITPPGTPTPTAQPGAPTAQRSNSAAILDTPRFTAPALRTLIVVMI